MDWATILITIGVGYVTLCLVFYLAQDLAFFRPEILPKSFQYKYPFPFEEVHFDMEDGGYINGLHFKVPNARGVVYYLKGNSRSVKGWGKFAKDFVSKGYDFFMVDYRGMGKSAGKRTETTLYNDAQHIYKWLEDKWEEEKIVLYGRSMGSGVATRIASWNKPKMLILDSPYFSFFYQIHRYAFILPLRRLLKYQIRTDQFIRKVTCPVFIVHGKKDRLIPFSQSEMLQQKAPGNVHLFPVAEARHNNLPDFAEYHEWLYDLLNDEAVFLKAKGEFAAA
ncbi:MAG: alpha/beta hydrolase [Bacteroidota bacterium]